MKNHLSTVSFALAGALLFTAGGTARGQELCNGIDDDDDGQTDEPPFTDCEPASTCVTGICGIDCSSDELICPDGSACEEVDGDYLCIIDSCNPLYDHKLACVENPWCCSDGFTPPCYCEPVPMLCVDQCWELLGCPDGYTCVPEDAGTCHPVGESCYVDGCPDGERCVDHECVDDPCHGVECEGEYAYCNDEGECVESCIDLDCPYGCFENECVDDPCAGILCEPGLSCEDGACIMGDCWNVVCEYYEDCVDGECVHDPCWNIECPDCFICIGGGCYQYEEPMGTDGDADGDADTDADADGDADTDSATDTADAGLGELHVKTRCMCETVGARSPGALGLFLAVLP